MLDHRTGVRLEDAPDAVLASRAADGDVRAFEFLIRRFTPLLRAYARRTLGATDELDDVVQDTFITAWERLDDLEDPAKVKSWLMRIVSHRCIDRIRARREHAQVDDLEVPGDDSISPDRVAVARSRQEALNAALDALPDAQRRCWIMKEALEYRYEDIAAELDLPVSTVRGLLARARKNMMQLMEAWR
ncbi:RNA polymerase sigma factor [Curtobacterium ammoniigenes]|uniref:RNA polymerase sigma factor n=1 Tax=Curtobacterium ammoniigenes TaxID=395387 RepID=UPI0008329E35|nr:RNA polymerase sigma factor [Curtobacterium ammoniigenes]